MPTPCLIPRFRVFLAVPLSAFLLVAVAAAPVFAQGASPPAAPAPAMKGPAVPAPLQSGDAFGDEVTLPPRQIVYLKGKANWDEAFSTLVDAFKSLNEYLAKTGLKPNGPFLTIYTETDDTGFSFEAAAPIEKAPDNPPKGDIAIGEAPAGRALKFVHRGSYDAMDSTYEAITNFLDDKKLDAKDLFIEEYATDPVKTDPQHLVINIYVPVK
ncbi:MAG TPA: GyrI-like domain-containing protein [Pseudolabrys sp.]|nr:GyrI-like domain-containing protein [Pseudolabrys sp.]